MTEKGLLTALHVFLCGSRWRLLLQHLTSIHSPRTVSQATEVSPPDLPLTRCPPNPKYNAVKISSLSSVLIWKWYLNYLIMIIFLTYDIKLFASKDVLNRPFFASIGVYGPTIGITKKKVMKLCNFVKKGSAAIKTANDESQKYAFFTKKPSRYRLDYE